MSSKFYFYNEQNILTIVSYDSWQYYIIETKDNSKKTSTRG